VRAASLLALGLLLGCGGENGAAPPPAPAKAVVSSPSPATAPATPAVAPSGDVPSIDALPLASSFPNTPKGLQNGAFVPELARPDLRGGGEYRLSAHVGPTATEDATKVVVVGMVASWCGPCTASLPLLKSLREQHGDALEVVLVATDADAAGRQKEADKVAAAGLDAAVLDPSDEDLVAWMGARRNVPHFYIVNKVGEVLVQDRGFGSKVRKVMPKQVDYALRHPEYVQRRKPTPRAPTPSPG